MHIDWRWGILLVLVLSGCGALGETQPQLTPTLTTFTQWAATAQASSAYGMPDWSVRRVVGAPDVNACADDSRAWASARGNGVEWLEVTFTQPVHATEVRIYQTFGRGAISRVSLLLADPLPDGAADREVVWEGFDGREPCPGALTIAFPTTRYLVDGVRVDLDESRTGSWNQIDAVALAGLR